MLRQTWLETDDSLDVLRLTNGATYEGPLNEAKMVLIEFATPM